MSRRSTVHVAAHQLRCAARLGPRTVVIRAVHRWSRITDRRPSPPSSSVRGRRTGYGWSRPTDVNLLQAWMLQCIDDVWSWTHCKKLQLNANSSPNRQQHQHCRIALQIAAYALFLTDRIDPNVSVFYRRLFTATIEKFALQYFKTSRYVWKFINIMSSALNTILMKTANHLRHQWRHDWLHREWHLICWKIIKSEGNKSSSHITC